MKVKYFSILKIAKQNILISIMSIFALCIFAYAAPLDKGSSQEKLKEIFLKWAENLVGLSRSPEEYYKNWEETNSSLYYIWYVGAKIQELINSNLPKEKILPQISQLLKDAAELRRMDYSKKESEELMLLSNNPEFVYNAYLNKMKTIKILNKMYDLALDIGREGKFPPNGEAYYRAFTIGDKHLYVVYGEHYSNKALDYLHSLLTSNLDPDNLRDWLFLIEGSSNTDIPEVFYAYGIAKALNITINNPIIDPYNKQVIEEAINRGMNKDEVYSALLLDMLAAIKNPNAVVEGLSNLWDISPDYLWKLIYRLNNLVVTNKNKFEEEKQKLKEISNALLKISNELSNEKFYQILIHHPEKSNILVYLGSAHYPVVKNTVERLKKRKKLLADIPNLPSAKLLSIISQTNDPELLSRAIQILGERKVVKAVEPLLSLLGSPDEEIRLEATDALVQIKDGIQDKTLKALVNNAIIVSKPDTSKEEKISAIQKLGELKDIRAVDVLARALGNEDLDIKFASMEALITMGKDIVQPLQKYLNDPQISDEVKYILTQVSYEDNQTGYALFPPQQEDSQNDNFETSPVCVNDLDFLDL